MRSSIVRVTYDAHRTYVECKNVFAIPNELGFFVCDHDTNPIAQVPTMHDVKRINKLKDTTAVRLAEEAIEQWSMYRTLQNYAMMDNLGKEAYGAIWPHVRKQAVEDLAYAYMSARSAV